MNRRLSSVLLFWICYLLLSCLLGCATIKKIDSALTSVGLLNDVSDPEPEFGHPDSSGLIVVDCQVFRDKSSNLLDAGEVLSHMFSSKKEAFCVPGGVLVDNEGHQVEGQEFVVDWSGTEKLIIFSDLHPGDYHLSQVTVTYDWEDEEMVYDEDEGHYVKKDVTRYTSSTIDIPPGQLEELTTNLALGQSAYVGKLTIFDARGDGDNQYQFDSDPNHEIEALKKLIGKYQDSQWVPSWRKRLTELEET